MQDPKLGLIRMPMAAEFKEHGTHGGGRHRDNGRRAVLADVADIAAGVLDHSGSAVCGVDRFWRRVAVRSTPVC